MRITKKIVLITLISGGAAGLPAQTAAPSSAAQTATPSSPAKTKKAKTPTKPAQVITIPKDAVKTNDGYRYTDSQGKVWIYRETPFGVTKAPEVSAPVEPVVKKDPDAEVKAHAEGDMIHFERPTPFGPTRWQKNKLELSAEEQKIWDREQAKGNR